MKIIHRGTAPEKVPFQLTCGSCATVVELVESELQTYSDNDPRGGGDYYKYVDCPECGRRIRDNNRKVVFESKQKL